MNIPNSHVMNFRYQIGNHFNFGERGDISYVPIPKCGSTAIRDAIININCKHPRKYDYKTTDGPLAEDEMLFTVIRNPLDRWMSGCLQYIHNNISGEHGKITDMLNRLASGELISDEHTLPMSEFLKEFDTKIKYFILSPSVLPEINSYYNLELKSTLINPSSDPDGVLHPLKEISKSARFQKHFQITYAKDLLMWVSVQKS